MSKMTKQELKSALVELSERIDRLSDEAFRHLSVSMFVHFPESIDDLRSYVSIMDSFESRFDSRSPSIRGDVAGLAFHVSYPPEMLGAKYEIVEPDLSILKQQPVAVGE